MWTDCWSSPSAISKLSPASTINVFVSTIECVSLILTSREIQQIDSLYIDGDEVLACVIKCMGHVKFSRVSEITLRNITRVPREFYNWTSIRRLDISGKKIKRLSKKVSRLHQLTHLHLSGTSIKYAPRGLSKVFVTL